MKRKLIALVLIVVALICALSFAACSNKNDNSLEMNVEYVYNDLINSETEKRSYIFYANGTGEYKYKGSSDKYTITFVYTYLDSDYSAVACYFDSIKYADSRPGNDNTWFKMLTVSKNVLMESSGSYFTNVNFLKYAPNYRSK